MKDWTIYKNTLCEMIVRSRIRAIGGQRMSLSQREFRYGVKSRHRVTFAPCPFFHSKQTFVSVSGTSALCQ